MSPLPAGLRDLRRRGFLMGAATSFLVPTVPALAEAVRPGGLAQALRDAAPGTVLRLSGGDHGVLELKRVDLGGVTVVSEDLGDPAALSGFDLQEVSGLSLEGLLFDYRFSPDHPVHIKPFRLGGCRDVALRGCLFDGEEAVGLSADVDGYGWGFALAARGCRGLTIEANEVRRFQRGFVLGDGDDVTIRFNEIHDLRSDGMDFVAMRGVMIEANHIHGFRRDPGAGDHADMIQFWSRNAERPSEGITIRGNVLMQGPGGSTQSIFMRNDQVDRGLAGREMFYRNIVIEENVVVNGHAHGITVGETRGLTIRNNTLLRHRDAAQGEDRMKRVRVPRISVAEAGEDVAVVDNIAAAVPDPRPGWLVEGNLLVQDLGPSQPGHYYQTVFAAPFTGDADSIESYVYLPGFLASSQGRPVGAALLRPDADRRRFR